MHKTLVTVNWLVVAALIISYISVYISPVYIWWPAFFGLAYPVLLIFNLLFITYWLIRRKWLFLISLFAILIGWIHISGFLQLDFANKKQQDTDPTFSLVSYNVRLFDLYNWSNNKETRDKILSFFKEENPEIIGFQEFYYDQTKRFNTLDTLVKFLDAKNIHTAFSTTVRGVYHFGIATMSKYPIVKRGEIKFRNTKNLCIYSDIKIGNDTVRVFNSHLESIHLQPENYRYIDSIEILNDSNQFAGARDIMKRIKYAYQKRAGQANIISQHIKKSPYPVIVCGDFNDTPVSYTYRKIRGSLKDAFIESGTGFGLTYNRGFPALRIDYIFHSEKIISSDFRIEKVNFSDHFPLLCEMKILQNEVTVQ